MGGKSNKKKGSNNKSGDHAKYAESASDRFTRIEKALSTLEQLSLAHIMAVTPEQKSQAMLGMQSALGVSLEERKMRETYQTQRAELYALKLLVSSGKQAEQKVAGVEAAIERTEALFAPHTGVPSESSDE